MFDNFLKALGGLFGGNDEEERRRRQQQQQQSAPRPTQATVGSVPSLIRNQSQPSQPDQPEPPKPAQPVMPSILSRPSQTYGNYDLNGLDDADQQTARRLVDQGKDASKFVAAAHNARQAQNQARYDNSLIGKTANFTGEVARQLTEGGIETAKTIGAMGNQSKADFFGTEDEQRKARIETNKHLQKSIPGMLFNDLGIISSKIAAAKAGHDLLDKGYDPQIVTDAMNAETNKFGVDTSDSLQKNITDSAMAAVDIGANVAGLNAAGETVTILKPGVNLISRRTGALRPILEAEERQLARQGEGAVNREVQQSIEIKASGDPDSAISVTKELTPAPLDEPAITSPNRPAMPELPTAVEPPQLPPIAPVTMPMPTAPAMPVAAQPILPPQITPAPVLQAPIQAAPSPAELQAAIVQRALDEAAIQPAPQAPPLAAAPVQSPLEAETAVLAAANPPAPTPAQMAQAEALIREAQAPTDAILRGTPEGSVAPISDGFSPNEVVQTVDRKTGDKTFFRIPAGQRDDIVNIIDNQRNAKGEGGIAGRNTDGKIYHVTARSPEDMAARGFTDGGTFSREKPETVKFNGRPHTIVDSLKTEGGTKYLLRDENGKEIWTNQTGLDSARAEKATVKTPSQQGRGLHTDTLEEAQANLKQLEDAGAGNSSLADAARLEVERYQGAPPLTEKPSVRTPTLLTADDYAMKVKNGEMSLSDVPEKLRSGVLDRRFDKDGNILPPTSKNRIDETRDMAAKGLSVNQMDEATGVPAHIARGRDLASQMDEAAVREEVARNVARQGRSYADVKKGQGGSMIGDFVGSQSIGGYLKGKKVSADTVGVELADGRTFTFPLKSFFDKDGNALPSSQPKGLVNPQTGDVTDFIETPDGPELVTIKKGTKQTPKDKFAENLEMDAADGLLPTTDGKSKATGGKTVSQTAVPIPEPTDPRIMRADRKAADHIAAAKKAGVDYDELVVKAYRNSADIKEGKVPKGLTPAEKEVWKSVKKDLDAVVSKLNKKGITDEDLGYIRGTYLPTTKEGELGRVQSVEDVANKDFGFAKTREGKLTDEEVKAGARQALEDYLRVGELIDDLDPKQIDAIKTDRINAETLKNLEGSETDPQRVTVDDETIADIRKETDDLVQAERKVTETTERIEKGDKSKDAINARTRAIREAHEKQQDKVVNDLLRAQEQTKKTIREINDSSDLTPGQKKERIEYLRTKLDTKEYRTRYLQTFTRSNALFQIPGRTADQIGKAVQSVGDVTFGVLGRLAENKAFEKAAGRPLRGDRATVRGVMKDIKGDPRLNPFRKNLDLNKKIADKQAKSGLGRLASRYRIYATAATELGSRYKAPIKDTVSFFVAKAQAEGKTDVDDIARYVQENIDTAEWKRVYGEYYRERNAFTGVPLYRRDLDGTITTPTGKVDAVFSKLDKGIEAAVSKVGIKNRRAQREIADAIRIPLVGFPRVVFNLGAKGFDHATFGTRDFIAAARIHPTDEASALRKAVLLRSAVESAQSGAVVGAIGMSLGAAGLISGAYPTDPSERKRWEAEKIQPFSIKMTGTDGKDHWFDISRFIGPYAFPLLLGAQMGNGGLDAKSGASIVGNIATQVSKNFGTESVGDFLGIAAKAAKGEWDGALGDIIQYLPNMAALGIPLSGALNSTAKLFDPNERSTEGDGVVDSTIKGLQRKIPGLRNSLDAKTDSFGNPLKEDGLSAFLPVSGGSDAKSDPIRAELSRLAEAGVEAYPTGVSGNSKHYTLKDANGDKISLGSKQQGALDNVIKEEKARQAKLVMESKTYQDADDQARGDMLKGLYSLDSSAIAADWAGKNGVTGVKATAEKINNKLSAEQQTALIEHRLQGDKKDVWLDNTDNAARFYEADYYNAEANGTLDYDDQHLDKASSKKYKMIAAQTNKEFGADLDLIHAYENISKSEFEDLPDGPDKNRLLALDLARAERGVSMKESDHSKSKYGYNLDGTLSDGKKGRRSGSSTSTVSLPSISSSLIGAPKTAEFQKAKRLYQPPKALLAPDDQPATPKRPTISVKRGVHL